MYFVDSINVENIPKKIYGWLITIGRSNNKFQLFYHWGNKKLINYIRNYISDHWENWEVITDYSNTLKISDLDAKILNYVDLNDVKTTGNYFQDQTNYATSERNYPYSEAGLLKVVYCSPVWIYQFYTTFDSNCVYKRVHTNKWNAWQKV